MLTATAACQPAPGPSGAAWPAARPGAGYYGPCPACCPPAPDRWPWAHAALAAAGPGTALYAVTGLMTLLTAALAVVVIREARRSRRLRGRA